jgi:hypothetical protein
MLDARLGQVVAEQPMAPVQVCRPSAGVDQDAAQLLEVKMRSRQLTAGSKASQRSQTSWRSSPLGKAMGRSTPGASVIS